MRHLLVVSNRNRLVGIITRHDLMGAHLHEMLVSSDRRGRESYQGTVWTVLEEGEEGEQGVAVA